MILFRRLINIVCHRSMTMKNIQLIACKLMIFASNAFHFTMSLSVNKKRLFIVFIFEIFFDYNPFNSFCCFIILIIVFDI